jgi:hypothetical protein
VSTQGRGDEAALQAALAAEFAHVAFVGSRKKAEALKAKLAERGLPAERLVRLKARRASISAPSPPTKSPSRSSPKSSPCTGATTRQAPLRRGREAIVTLDLGAATLGG